ncbi:hypothetical protein BMS3Bbin09_00050 [bacterium BMS3Bbin09]|nr:hypothetical protein BMS3Bbin09_00050 [bacterium BMS3Bbin09]
MNITSAGAITDSSGATIAVTGLATINAGSNAITLGDNGGDTTNFGSLNVTGGAVTVTEDSATDLASVNSASLNVTSAGTLTATNVTSTGDITLTASTGDMVIGTITGGNDVTLNATSGTIDGSGTVSGNLATINTQTIGLTTEPTMNVNSLTLTFTDMSGGFSGKMLSGAALVNKANVTIVSTPGTVRIGSWLFDGSGQDVQDVTQEFSSYSSQTSTLTDMLSALEPVLADPDFFNEETVSINIDIEGELGMPGDEEIANMSLEKEILLQIIDLKEKLESLDRGDDVSMSSEQVEQLKRDIEEDIAKLMKKLAASNK